MNTLIVSTLDCSFEDFDKFVKALLDELTLDHYQDLSGGGFLISTPKKATKSSCGSGFKFNK